MFKIFTCMEDSGVTKASSGLWPRVKRVHSSAVCFKTWVQGAMPLTGVLLPYLVFEYSRLHNCKEHTENW